MLQFLVSDKELRFTPVEQTELALAGGCRWIHIPSGLGTEEVKVIENLCREAGAFLTVDDDEALTNQRRFHGVLINRGHVKAAEDVRSELGPHAVVGVEVDEASVMPSLMKNDIDYAVYDIDRNGEDKAVAFAEECGMRHVPIVARGKSIKRDEIMKLMNAGFNGVLTSGGALDAALPTEVVKSLSDELHERY